MQHTKHSSVVQENIRGQGGVARTAAIFYGLLLNWYSWDGCWSGNAVELSAELWQRAAVGNTGERQGGATLPISILTF